MKSVRKLLMTSIGLTILCTCLVTAPSQADTPTAFGIKASQTQKLYDGQTISIQTLNLPTDKGIYVVQCPLIVDDPTKPEIKRPDSKNCTSLKSNPQSVLWVSKSQTPGALNPATASGFVVVKTLGATDCSSASAACGLVTSRDHVDRTDRSLDTITELSFSKIIPTINKTTGLVDAGDTLNISIAGLPANAGVYVRLCQLTSDNTNPTDCYGNGTWATLNSLYLNPEVADASKTFNLAVKGTFTKAERTIDCQLVTCGIFIRRDHVDPTDRTLDTIIPVSFAPPVKAVQTVSGWAKKPGNVTLKVGKTQSLATKNLKTNQNVALTWATNKPSVCNLTSGNSGISVVGVKSGTCIVTAKAAGHSRAVAKTYTWNVTISK